MNLLLVELLIFVQFEVGWKVLKELLIFEGVSTGKTGSPEEYLPAFLEVQSRIIEKYGNNFENNLLKGEEI